MGILRQLTLVIERPFRFAYAVTLAMKTSYVHPDLEGVFASACWFRERQLISRMLKTGKGGIKLALARLLHVEIELATLVRYHGPNGNSVLQNRHCCATKWNTRWVNHNSANSLYLRRLVHAHIRPRIARQENGSD
jgi:hypothetical protein